MYRLNLFNLFQVLLDDVGMVLRMVPLESVTTVNLPIIIHPVHLSVHGVCICTDLWRKE
jgi:hypothetical protein